MPSYLSVKDEAKVGIGAEAVDERRLNYTAAKNELFEVFAHVRRSKRAPVQANFSQGALLDKAKAGRAWKDSE